MVFQPKPALSVHDWHVLGHEMDPDNPHVPMRRCDMPIPYNMDGLNVLVCRTASLSKHLQELVREVKEGKETVRGAIRRSMSTIYLFKRDFADLARDWDEEYAQLIRTPHLKLRPVEQTMDKQATGQ